MLNSSEFSVIIVILITIPVTVFIVLSSCQSHFESSLGSRDEYRMVPGGRQPLDEAKCLESQACL